MKNICSKISNVMKTIFGYGVTICLLGGGLTFFGYMAALIIGGETATEICTVIYKTIFPYIIKASVILVLFGLLAMYLNGEMALNSEKKKK